MSEDVSAASEFSIERAVATIDRATAYDAPLRQRTEGMTWVGWGLVSILVPLLFNTLGEDAFPWWLWMIGGLSLWLGLGFLVTSCVWRIASLSSARLRPSPRTLVLVGLAGVALLVVFLEVLWWLAPYKEWPALVGVSIFTWAALAAVQWGRLTTGGRKGTLAVGAAMIVVSALLVVLWGPGEPPEGSTSQGIAVVAGLVPIAAGFVRSFQT